MATAGNLTNIGRGLYCASDVLTATNPDWAAVAASTYVKIHSINAVGATGAAVGTITITDAGGTAEVLIDAMTISTAAGVSAPLNIAYKTGKEPILNGLKIVTSAVSTNIISYSIIYSLVDHR
jgi:hypothetical protein